MNTGKLAKQFGTNPFTPLDARAGWWQRRKRRWHGLGFDSAKGRKTSLIMASDWMLKHQKATMGNTLVANNGVSVFDPVICELTYLWFSKLGDKVIDPFAGGSVRGLVAAYLGRNYTGIDVRKEQIAENQNQQNKLRVSPKPVWKHGSAVNFHGAGVRGKFDLAFTCPPYGDLERYSDQSDDISNMSYDEFLGAFRQSVKQSFKILYDNRFSVMVVGDFRDGRGNYRGFVADAIQAHRDAGFELYNDALLLTALGTLPMRVGKQFSNSRKLGKAHQNYLVFVKGDGAAATKRLGKVQPFDLDSISPLKDEI
jgi:hypothetical protein